MSKGNGNGNIILKLGDVIQIQSPTNTDIHEQTFFIDYINETRIQLINVATISLLQLNMDENGYITDESIVSIYLLHRNNKEGYARQNNLLPGTWLDIYIGGEFPSIITGEVTNLEEDMIEVTTFPDLQVIYIDFEYKGIPENIPFEKFIVRNRPNSIRNSLSDIAMNNEITMDGNEIIENVSDATMEYTNTGETIIHIPENAIPDKNFREVLHSIYLEANDIIFGEELDEIIQAVELPEREHRYGVELQVNDLMDELLSTIPNSKRTKEVLDNIHNLIERFKQMRTKYSVFDENGNILKYIKLGVNYKPLVERILALDTKIQWILPVVSQKKKIYPITNAILKDESDVYMDILPTDLSTELFSEEQVLDTYKQRNTTNGINRYSKYHADIDMYSNPIRADMNIESSLVENQPILTNLDTVVNNLEDFYSTVIIVNKKKEEIARKKFVIQRYNLGLMKKDVKLMKSGKNVYIRNNMTANDKMTIKSLLFLPEPIVKFSQIALPGTKLITKTGVHSHYLQLFRLLNQKTEVTKYIVDDLEKELDYEKIEATEKVQFLSTIKEYSLDEEYHSIDNKFEKFLNVIIPKTRMIIRLIRKYIHDKLSFIEIIKELEPFMIYSDSISYGQYQEVRYFIKEKIKEFRLKYAEKTQLFKTIRGFKYTEQSTSEVNRMVRLLQEGNGQDTKHIFFMFQDAYHMKDIDIDKVPSNEILSKIIQMDCGTLYTNLINVLTIQHLSTPQDLLLTFQPATIDDLTNLEKIKPQDCIRRYLTKKYTSVKDLQSDNNKEEVYYDKEYDDTIYSIMNNYKKEQKNMEAKLFLEFLIENLIMKHDAPANYAAEIANTLIVGKKVIKDGEYAVLELQPKLPNTIDETKLSEQEKHEIEIEANARTVKQYYKRIKSQWVHDDTIDTETFIDTNTLFCNIRPDCTKNQSNNICEPKNAAQLRMTELTKARMVKEFGHRVNESIEQLEKKIKNVLGENFKQIVKNTLLKEVRLCQFNKIAFDMGKRVNKEDIIVSPYQSLRELIFSQDDFIKKQNDIVRFSNNFCREPMVQALKEDIHWLYCKETNTKLLPFSLYELANTFISGMDYQTKLEQICRTNGVDEGDTTFDKYTGCILRKIDFVTEDEYTEEGFRIVSHAIMEDDLETSLTKMFSNRRIFENELNEIIFNITHSICLNIGIDTDTIVDFVTRTTLEVMNKHIQDPKKYEENSVAFEKKTGRRPIPYTIYKNRLMFWIISSHIIVSIQTAIPSIKLQKTFPRCVRSIRGYPIDGIENLSGIQYISCVLHGLKSEIVPWDSIYKLPQTEYVNKIKETLEKWSMKQTDFLDLYTKKKEYMILQNDEMIPEEHNIQQWTLLLPPIVNIEISQHITNISSDLQHEMIESIRKGHKSQRNNLCIIQSKVIRFGYGIMERIHRIIKNKDLLLKTSRSQTPFMENACCNENLDYRPIDYFVKEDPTILQYIQSILTLSELYEETTQLSKAKLLYHPKFTGNIYPIIENIFTEENIYAAYIYYCNLDNELPIPISLRNLFPEKPTGYKPSWTLLDKIEFFKKNAMRYNEGNLHQLMQIIQDNNRVEVMESPVIDQIQVMFDLLDRFDTKQSEVIEDRLRTHLRSVFSSYQPQKMYMETRPELKKLKDYLAKSTTNMYYEIIKFFDKYGNLNDKEYEKVQEFFMDISKTDLNHKDHLYRSSQFIRTSVYFMTKVLPTMIMNQCLFKKTPEHWNFADIHYQDLSEYITKFWENILPFYGNKLLHPFFSYLQNRIMDLYLFIQELPIYSPIYKNENIYYSLFDEETIHFLHIYVWYSTIYEYIQATHDPDILNIELEEKKKMRRSSMVEMNDISLQTKGNDNKMDDDTAEYNMDLQEMEIRGMDTEELKSLVASLVLSFVTMEQENKRNLLSYAEISKKIRKSKKQEKDKMTDYLSKMEEDERTIEKQFKKYKMGRWNIGMQKGLVHYDSKTYEREREEFVFEQPLETIDIQDLEKEERYNQEQEETEGTDIHELGEDYMDGQYYPEDQDENDFGEE